MRKRILSLFLCLCLLAGFLPMGTMAAPAASASPGLNVTEVVMSNGNWTSQEDYSSGYQGSCGALRPYYLQFVYISAAGAAPVPLTADQLTFPASVQVRSLSTSDPSLLEVTFAELGMMTITYSAGTLGGEYDQVSYSSVLPVMGWYSAATAGLESYIPATTPIDLAAGGKTVYVVGRTSEDYIYSIRCDNDGVNVTLSPDNRYAEVQLTDAFQGDSLTVYLSGTSVDPTWTQFDGMRLWLGVNDLRPGLYFREAYFETDPDTGELIWHEYDTKPLQNARTQTTDGRYRYYFYLRNNSGVLSPVNVEDITFPAGITVEDVQGNFACLTIPWPGTYTLEAGGFQLPITVTLPNFGFYSAAEATEANFITEWEYTGQNDTVYLIAREGCTLTQVQEGSGNGAVITLSDDGTFATIRVAEPVSSNLSLNISGTWSGTQFTNVWRTLPLNDQRPGLCFRPGYFETDPDTGAIVWHENDAMSPKNSRTQWADDTYPYYFYMRNNSGVLSPVNVEDITFPTGVTVEDVQGNYARLTIPRPGTYTLEAGGYQLPITVMLPTFGFYSAAEATEANLITEWEYTGQNDTVYLIAREGYTFTQVQEYSGNGAAITLSDDGTCAAIKVIEPVFSNLTVTFSGVYPSGASFDEGRRTLPLNDLRPGLFFRPGYFETDPDTGDLIWHENDAMPIQNTWTQTAEGRYRYYFYLRNNSGVLSPVNVEDITFPAGVIVEDVQGNFACLTIPRPGTYTLEAGGYQLPITVTLPYFGFYSAAEATEANLITEWAYTGQNDTVYLFAREGYTFTQVQETNGNGASITLSDDGTCAAIRVTEPVSSVLFVTFSGKDTSGATFDSGFRALPIVHGATHALRHTADTAHTCTTDGNIEYWTCMICGKYFADANASAELTAAQLVDAAAHALTRVEAVAATIEAAGNIEYWKCSTCGKLFANENADAEIALVDTIIPALTSGTSGGVVPSGGSAITSGTVEETTVTNEGGSKTTTVTGTDGTVTETTENADGSKVETVTNTDGSSKETVTEADGSSKETVTDTDGSTEITSTSADGSTATVKADADGNITEARTEISAEAVAAAAEGPITLGLELTAAENSAEAPELSITIPEEAGSVTVEIPVKDVSSTSVVVLVHEDGTEEVLPKTAMTEDGVAITVSGNVTVKIVDNEKEFGDVEEDYWGSEAIDYVTSRELFQGTGEDTFEPELTMTRAMIVTVLYRMESKPEVESGTVFTDVPEGQWYSEAVAWASSSGIVTGYGDTFGKDDPVTREQLVLMLYRLAGEPETEPVETGASDWAAEAMSWAVSIGLIQGDGESYNAKDTATRAETATLLMRYING